jgi:hypothetical protein
MYQYLVIGRDKSYFVKSHSKSNNKHKQGETIQMLEQGEIIQMLEQGEIIQMLDFIIDNIFALFGGRVFQQTIYIPMGTNCVLPLANLFLHAYEVNFLQGLLKNKDR